MTVNSLSAQHLPGERQCFSLQSACSQASNFSVASCTAIAIIFSPSNCRRNLIFTLLGGLARCFLLCLSHPALQIIPPALAHLDARSPAFGQLFVNWDNRTKQMEGLLLPTIGHCMLSTAVHAEQTNIRFI